MNDLVALLTPASSILARALAGPAATLALRLLGRAVLGDEDATPEALADALKAGDPEAKLKIARAEADFQREGGTDVIQQSLYYESQKERAQALIELETVAANDRADARHRQQVTNDRTNAYLAYIVTVGFFLTVLLTLRLNLSRDTSPVVYTLLGILGTGWTSMMAFYFGSSVGSREKNALLGEANTPPKSIGVTQQT